MNTIEISEAINHGRRRLLGAAVMSIAATPLVLTGSADAQPAPMKPAAFTIKLAANSSFEPLKQIDAGVLNVGYAEAGPADGPVGDSAARLALRHPHLCRCRAAAGAGRLPRDRARICAAMAPRAFCPARPSATASRRRSPLDVIALMDALKHRDRRSSPAATGARARPTSSRRSGRSAARPWFRSAAI